MPWVRFDDQYPANRKIAGLSDAAFRLHTEAIHWCARNLTDGFIDADDLPLIRPQLADPEQHAKAITSRRLWHLADEECDSPHCPAGPVDNPRSKLLQGWFIHDYFEYQPTREKVLRERKIRAESGRLGGVASGKSRRSGRKRNKRSKREANPKQVGSVSVEPRPVPGFTPNPTADAAGDCPTHGNQPHANCRGCGTNPRGKPPSPEALRHPSARPVAEVLAEANGAPLGRHARTTP